MADGPPKDYSSLYCDDEVPTPRPRVKRMDGAHPAPMRHRESKIDLGLLHAKLSILSKADNNAIARDHLSSHYNRTIRRKPVQNFRVFLQYKEEEIRYLVHVDCNLLRAVKDKLPKQGNYRYFFEHQGTYEEIEYDDMLVPYHEKDGNKTIHCLVIPSMVAL